MTAACRLIRKLWNPQMGKLQIQDQVEGAQIFHFKYPLDQLVLALATVRKVYSTLKIRVKVAHRPVACSGLSA